MAPEKNKTQMNGWVIVYLPGGDVYQMLDASGTGKQSLGKRILRHGVKAAITAAQIYWWIRG